MCSNNTYECDRAKEIFGDVKNECKIGLSYVKKVAISGGRKIKDWYEIYSGKWFLYFIYILLWENIKYFLKKLYLFW